LIENVGFSLADIAFVFEKFIGVLDRYESAVRHFIDCAIFRTIGARIVAVPEPDERCKFFLVWIMSIFGFLPALEFSWHVTHNQRAPMHWFRLSGRE
jgi:hypothetical protein